VTKKQAPGLASFFRLDFIYLLIFHRLSCNFKVSKALKDITMKITIILLVSLLIFNFAKAQYQSIYADVQGNIATIWETEAERNCGALYQMNVDLENYQIIWIQQDTGAAAFCICNFDLSVTIGPLSSGTYNVLVYHTEITSSDTLFDGSTIFIIEQQTLRDSISIISQYQSDCHGGVDIKEDTEITSNWIDQNYPNPFSTLTWIHYCLINEGTEQLIIYNIYGQVVSKMALNAADRIISWDGRDRNGINLPAGIYYYKLESQQSRDCRRMILTGN
jgi:hypothetical protein